MLVITRKLGEQVVIGDSVVLTVLGLHGSRVRLGIAAPSRVAVRRSELSPLAGAPAKLADEGQQRIMPQRCYAAVFGTSQPDARKSS